MTPPDLSLKTLFTLAMACIRVCPSIGLSINIVCIDGTSNPVSHISLTITIFSSSELSFILLANKSRLCLLPICFCSLSLSAALPLITTLILPLSISSLCQSGLRLIISSYKSTQIRLLIQTTIAFPSIALDLFS